MMSISPHTGHPTSSKFAPSIQNAGQIPCPRGSLMRASNRPFCSSNRSLVVILPEVYGCPRYSSSRAVIARLPAPSRETFSARSVSYSSWALPQSVPMSKRQLAGSGSWPAGPSNSSSHTSCQSVSPGPEGESSPQPASGRTASAHAVANRIRLGNRIIGTSPLAVAETSGGRPAPPAVPGWRHRGRSCARRGRRPEPPCRRPT